MTPWEPQNRQAVDQTSRDPHAAVGGLSVSSLSEPTSVMVIVASQLSRWLDFAPRGSRLLSAMAPTPPVARRPHDGVTTHLVVDATLRHTLLSPW
jgi:hypothetical protein